MEECGAIYLFIAARHCGILDSCVFNGQMRHDDVQELMKTSDVLLFTSVAEGTPHVVLGAIANCLPVVCFDSCGQGDCVHDCVGMKVLLSNPKQFAKDFAGKIDF